MHRIAKEPRRAQWFTEASLGTRVLCVVRITAIIPERPSIGLEGAASA